MPKAKWLACWRLSSANGPHTFPGLSGFCHKGAAQSNTDNLQRRLNLNETYTPQTGCVDFRCTVCRSGIG